ncbi:MAG: DUF4136 domain-containing protein [Flavobacteriales bacterium]|jgi:hypothetical protein|nr:DUF4136 domain-containing protein [Flavobacteriales bacterium]
MKHTARAFLVAAFVPLLFSGCYPEQPDYINEYDLVYTNHAPDFDFQGQGTYALPDSVVILGTGDPENGELPSMVDPFFANRILAQIRANMSAYGWTEVADADSADVVLLPSAVKTLNIDAYYYYGGYWGWYYPYGGYGWYYPGYYPTYTSYTTGSLIMQINVPKDVSPSENVPVVWVGVINGLLEGSDASIADRIVANIDQAFKQSEYLKQ